MDRLRSIDIQLQSLFSSSSSKIPHVLLNKGLVITICASFLGPFSLVCSLGDICHLESMPDWEYLVLLSWLLDQQPNTKNIQSLQKIIIFHASPVAGKTAPSMARQVQRVISCSVSCFFEQ